MPVATLLRPQHRWHHRQGLQMQHRSLRRNPRPPTLPPPNAPTRPRCLPRRRHSPHPRKIQGRLRPCDPRLSSFSSSSSSSSKLPPRACRDLARAARNSVRTVSRMRLRPLTCRKRHPLLPSSGPSRRPAPHGSAIRP